MRFAGALTSVDVVNRAAAGWGLVSADPVAGVIRSVPLVAAIDGTLVPAFAIEMLRVAAGAPALRLVRSGPAVQGVGIAKVLFPTAADGSVRLYFSHRDARRFVSAADVLNGRVDPERLRDKLVIVAVTSLGLGEYHYTPVGERMPGSEIHAQLLENLYEGTLLSRPAWAAGSRGGRLRRARGAARLGDAGVAAAALACARAGVRRRAAASRQRARSLRSACCSTP